MTAAIRTYQPHQQRVIDEKAALDAKVEALGNFIVGREVYPALPQAEKDRLHLQCIAMDLYSTVLEQRIAAFPV